MSCSRGSSRRVCALLNTRRACSMNTARCGVRSEQSLACTIGRIIGCRALSDGVGVGVLTTSSVFESLQMT
jgi:hypothetical protein